MSDRILIVDDEVEIADLIETYLQSENYSVSKFYSAKEALDCIQTTEFDLAVLDIMMPEIDGLTLCRKIRERYTYPVIMLTARDGETDKITGLMLGADDYVTKPFNILEVKARIKAIMRRSSRSKEPEDSGKKKLTCKDLTLDGESRRIFIKDREINLTAKEFDLLELLLTHPGKVYSREKLLNVVWGYEYPGDVRTVDVHVRRLREKIENNPSDPQYVHTKWGVGYYFKG